MRKSIIAAAATAGAALATAGVITVQAVTAIPPNTLHGCVTGTNRALTHVYSSSTSGTTCASGFQVIWPNGPDKDQPVTAGPAGLDVIQVGSTSTGGVRQWQVSCPADHPYVVGGGGFADEPLAKTMPDEPGGGQLGGWVVSSAPGSPVPQTLTAWALCTK